MTKSIRILLAILFFGCLFLVRAFEMELFYDPLIEYFQNEYLYSAIPEIDKFHLLADMFFRYLINSIISLAIIYVIFSNKHYLKFSSVFMIIAFFIMIIVFALLLQTNFESGYLFPFYIRRFIVHPLFLFILLPAFYYLDKKALKD